MKTFLCLMIFGLMLNSCKQSVDTTPVPIVPITFAITADSIKLNSSGYSPLTALVNFSFATAGRTFIRVRGKHGTISNVEHTFNDKGTYHSIPIVGLYSNYANKVDIHILDDAGSTLAQSTITIQTGNLPPNLPEAITVAPFVDSKIAPGFILVSNYSTIGTKSPATPFFMDAFGEIRWVLDYRTNALLKALSFEDGIARLRNGHFFFGDSVTDAIYEVDLLGQILNTWSIKGYLFHHNVSEEPNGNFVMTATKPGSTNTNGTPTVEDYVIELERSTGNVLTVWDLKQSLDEHRTALAQSPYFSMADWFHGNSVVYDSTDNSIVVSGRHQGVVKLDFENRVKWILGAHRGWGINRRDEALSQFLLKPLDGNGAVIKDTAVINGSKASPDFQWNWYQHSNIFLPNGAIMVFDNGEVREFAPGAPKYSRAVAYKINPTKMTVQQVWSYGQERGLDTYSQIVSSVQFLTGTNHVIFAPGYDVGNITGNGGKVLEIDATTKAVLSEISISSVNTWGFHRAKKMSVYP